MEVKFLSWDWRSGPDPVSLVETINGFSSGPIYAVQVDTGDADPTIALSNTLLTGAQAYALWVAQ